MEFTPSAHMKRKAALTLCNLLSDLVGEELTADQAEDVDTIIALITNAAVARALENGR